MYNCGYTVKEVHVCVTHDTYITTTEHSLQQYCIITPEGRGRYRHVHIHICIYAQNSVYTVHTYVRIYRGDFSPTLATYSNCMGIFRLHSTTTEIVTLSVRPLNYRVTMCTSYTLYTVVSGFLVQFTHCTPQSLTHVINILELGSSREFQLQ